MHLRSSIVSILCGLCLTSVSTTASPESVLNTQEPTGAKVTFSFGGDNGQEFLLNGKPFQIRGGEMHPQRIPKEYWRHRIRAAKAMGLNTIAFYTFWNDFEQADGSFDFKTGNRDIAAFLRICQEEGMWVLFRPGPYVCGEWDLGGLPSYLLKRENVQLRITKNEEFMKAQTRYLEAIAKIAAPFLCKNGGPILMTQLENEYGSYNGETEKAYVEWLLNWWTKKGFGPFYTSDGSSPRHLRYTLPGVAVGLDPGENDGHWASANKANPGVPVFSSETYPGWLRHWGEGNWKPTDKRNVVRWYMDKGRSFNLFVLHGGTNFGKTAGANSANGAYQPDLTSYDYGSPLGENGNMTDAYFHLREIIASKLPEGVKLPEPPAAIETAEIAPFTPKRVVALRHLFTAPIVKNATKMPWFESFGQNQGMAVYSTTVPAGDEAKLEFENVHDYALVYMNGQQVGKLDRRLKERSLMLPSRDKKARLDIVVDTMGHINFFVDMERDRKGIYGKATLGDHELKNWTVYPLALDSRPTPVRHAKKSPSGVGKIGGALFRANVNIDDPKDTFLDMSRYARGYVWVNGHCLGRFWNIGPQHRLYCPAPFLKKGANEVLILDIELDEPQPIRGMNDRNREPGTVNTKNLDNSW